MRLPSTGNRPAKPRMHLRRHSRRIRARGLSLIEVMISLAISAMLLGGVAAAFSASTAAVENNDQFFRCSQSARVALNLMLAEIRRSSSIAVPSSSTRLDMITADLQDISYVYTFDAAVGTGTLKLVKNATNQEYFLARNVKSLSFTADTALGAGGITHVARVTASLNVEIGDNQVRLIGSAAPRRVQAYKD